jgi:hypothetical protein
MKDSTTHAHKARGKYAEIDVEVLPEPISRLALDAVVHHKALMGDDDESRLAHEAVEYAVKLHQGTRNRLLQLFGQAIAQHPFTVVGVPNEDERKLTIDIWDSISQEERQGILLATRQMVAKRRNKTADGIPDQTPYAMRLTHLYAQHQTAL